MKKAILTICLSVTSLLLCAQYYDTIRVGSGVTTLIEFKGNAEIRQLDISGSATQNIKLAKSRDLYYAVMDSTASIMKFKATRPFTDKIIMTVFSDTTVQYLFEYAQDPVKTYYSYNLAKNDYSAAKGQKAKGVNKKVTEGIKDDPDDIRSNLEKNEGELINPKNKLFTAVRSKNQNIAMGDIKAGVRIYLQKFYKSKELTYFQFKISNFSMADFQLQDFAINKVDGGSDTKLTEIHEESAFNLLKRYEKVDFIVIVENLELSIGGKLVFTFSGKGQKEKGFQFEMDYKDFDKRELL